MKVLTLRLEKGLADLTSLEPSPVTTTVVHVVEVSTDGDAILAACAVPNGIDSFVVYLCKLLCYFIKDICKEP